MPRALFLKVILLAGLLTTQGWLAPQVATAEDHAPIPILPRAAERGDAADRAELLRDEISVNPLSSEMVSVRLTSRGANREAALEQARANAVLAAAGRVLLDDYLIRANQLMRSYLGNYAADFITGVEVLSDRFTGGEVVLDSRVFVNFAALAEDLQEKRFLFRPAYKPMFTIFMAEELEGQRITQEIARSILQSKLTENDIKNYVGLITSPAVSVDVVAEGLLGEALVASERRNVEVLISGSTRTRQIEGLETRRVYYDTFFFYESEMDATVIRVDTGEELFSLSAKGAAAARDRAEAIRLAIERAADIIARDTNAQYRDQWRNVVRGDATYEILLTGVDEELINIVKLHLDRLAGDTEIYLKKHFDRSAVLSIVTTANRAELLEALRACPYPTLSVIREVGSRRFEVRVSG